MPDVDNEKSIRRVVIFTGDLAYSVRKGIAALARAYPSVSWLVCVQRASPPLATRLRRELRQLRRNGWIWIPHRIVDVASVLRERLRTRAQISDEAPGGIYQWEQISQLANVSSFQVADLHDAESQNRVRKFAPDLGVSLAAPILKPSIFEIPRFGTVNLHKGKLPEYRGMPPAFWEIYHDEQEIGCTVHAVTRDLDAGAILLTRTIVRKPFSTVRSLQLELDEIGIDLVVQVLERIAHGTSKPEPQSSGGRTFTKPTLREQSIVRDKEAGGRGGFQPRQIAKDLVLGSYVSLVRPIPRTVLAWSGRQRIVVLLYHRVNDVMRDSLTVGVEQFEQQMKWLRSEYQVVSIEDIVRDRVSRTSPRPLIAVTFDDGYLDNYENAVPILLRYRVPAAFFVSTGIVDSDRGFPHDRRIGRLPTMTWDQLREMRQHGFVIGSHTVSHLDCGVESLDLVRCELAESKSQLELELGPGEWIFAFPFGGRQNITPGVLKVVKELGFIGCLSAHGGVNDTYVCPFDVLRVGINHAFSMPAFRSRLEGFA